MQQIVNIVIFNCNSFYLYYFESMNYEDSSADVYII